MSIPPSGNPAGFRFFVRLLALALGVYTRHKGNIDSTIQPEIATAIGVLLDVLPALIAQNPPGPE